MGTTVTLFNLTFNSDDFAQYGDHSRMMDSNPTFQ